MGRQGFVCSEIQDEAITFQKYFSTKAFERSDCYIASHGAIVTSLSEKNRYITIKGRTMTGKNKQHGYISKEDAS